MPIKLNSDQLYGGRINKTMILKMVNFYRANRMKDGQSLKFSHFSAFEMLSLFADNGIIKPLTKAQKLKAKPFGVKIYMANHANDGNTCPQGCETTYLIYDTTIICNTKLNGKIWEDLLKDDQDFISLAGGGDGGDGLDKGSICPPDCPPAIDVSKFGNEDVITKP